MNKLFYVVIEYGAYSVRELSNTSEVKYPARIVSVGYDNKSKALEELSRLSGVWLI